MIHFANLDNRDNKMIKKLAIGSVYALDPSMLRVAERTREIKNTQSNTMLSKNLNNLKIAVEAEKNKMAYEKKKLRFENLVKLRAYKKIDPSGFAAMEK
jgi:hypothetical protein